MRHIPAARFLQQHFYEDFMWITMRRNDADMVQPVHKQRDKQPPQPRFYLSFIILQRSYHW
jgi:hypothetical protein